MDYFFEWIFEEKLAVCQRPGYPWDQVSPFQIQKFTSYLHQQKIDTVICLLTPEELQREFLRDPLNLYQEQSLKTYHYPIPPDGFFSPETLSQLLSLVEQQLLQENRKIVFHGQFSELRIQSLKKILQNHNWKPLETQTPHPALPQTSPAKQQLEQSLQHLEILLDLVKSYQLQHTLDEKSSTLLEELLRDRRSTLKGEIAVLDFIQPPSRENRLLLEDDRSHQLSPEKLPQTPSTLPEVEILSPSEVTNTVEKEEVLEVLEESPQSFKQQPATLPVEVELALKESETPLATLVLPKTLKKGNVLKKPKLLKFPETTSLRQTEKPLKKYLEIWPLFYEKALWFFGFLFILIASLYWVSRAWTDMAEQNRLVVLFLSFITLGVSTFSLGSFLKHLKLFTSARHLKYSTLLLAPLAFLVLGELCRQKAWPQLFWGATTLCFFYFVFQILKEYEPVSRPIFGVLWSFFVFLQIPLSFVQSFKSEAFFSLSVALSLFLGTLWFSRQVLPQVKRQQELHQWFFYSLLTYSSLFSLGHLMFRIAQTQAQLLSDSASNSGLLDLGLGVGSQSGIFLLGTLGSVLLLYYRPSESLKGSVQWGSALGLTFTLIALLWSLQREPSTSWFYTKLLGISALLMIVYWQAAFQLQRVYLLYLSFFLALSTYFLTPLVLKLQLSAVQDSFLWFKEMVGYEGHQKLPLNYYPLTFFPLLGGMAYYTVKKKTQLSLAFYQTIHRSLAFVSLSFFVFLAVGTQEDLRPPLLAFPLYFFFALFLFQQFRHPFYLVQSVFCVYGTLWYATASWELWNRSLVLLLPLLALATVVETTKSRKVRENLLFQMYSYSFLLFVFYCLLQYFYPPYPLPFYLLSALGFFLATRSFSSTAFPSFASLQLLQRNLPHFTALSFILGTYLLSLDLGYSDTLGLLEASQNFTLAQALLLGGFSVFYSVFTTFFLSHLKTPTRLWMAYSWGILFIGLVCSSLLSCFHFSWPLQILFTVQSLALSFLYAQKTLPFSPFTQRFEVLALFPILLGFLWTTGFPHSLIPELYSKELYSFIFPLFCCIVLALSKHSILHARALSLLLPAFLWIGIQSHSIFSLNFLWSSLILFYGLLSHHHKTREHFLVRGSWLSQITLGLYGISLLCFFGSFLVRDPLSLFSATSYFLLALGLYAFYEYRFYAYLALVLSMVLTSEVFRFSPYFPEGILAHSCSFWGLGLAWIAYLELMERFSSKKVARFWYPFPLIASGVGFILFFGGVLQNTIPLQDQRTFYGLSLFVLHFFGFMKVGNSLPVGFLRGSLF
jgi:hypothetical protein